MNILRFFFLTCQMLPLYLGKSKKVIFDSIIHTYFETQCSSVSVVALHCHKMYWACESYAQH